MLIAIKLLLSIDYCFFSPVFSFNLQLFLTLQTQPNAVDLIFQDSLIYREQR